MLSESGIMQETRENMYFVVYGAVGIAIISTIATITATLYRSMRPKFPVKVNCWFCSEDTEVPYGNKECWDCPKCEQYNGFAQDGDYNKPIPAQFVEEFNHLVTPEHQTESFNSSSDVLCYRCKTNQLLKIKQLANFSPISELTFDLEVDSYKARLEQTYPLCRLCDEKVHDVIDKQDRKLRRKLIREGLDPDRAIASDSFNSSRSEGNLTGVTGDTSFSTQSVPSSLAAKLLEITCVLVTMALCVMSVDNIISQSHYWATEPGKEHRITNTIRSLYRLFSEITVFGFACTLILIYKNKRKRPQLDGALLCTAWALLLTVSVLHRGQSPPPKYSRHLQTGLSVATLVLLVWSLVPRPEDRVIRINTKKSRLSFGGGSLSCSGVSDQNSPAPSLADDDDRSSVVSEEDGCFSDFETMSLGALPLRRRNRLHCKTDIFSAYTASSSNTPPSTHTRRYSPTSTSPFHQAQHSPTSLKQTLAQHSPTSLQQTRARRKPLISPARFKHRSAPVWPTQEFSVSPSPSRSSVFGSASTRGFGLGTSRNSLFQSGPWSRTGSPSHVSDDVASLFSEHREPKHTDMDKISHHSGSRSSGSVCPVGTTFNDPETHTSNSHSPGPTPSIADPVSRHWWRPLLAVSVVLNVALFVYFVIDVPKALDNICFLILSGIGQLEGFVKGFRMQLNHTHDTDTTSENKFTN